MFTVKQLCWSLFLIKLEAFWFATLLKKRLRYRYFLVIIAKFLRTPILKNISERLLLKVSSCDLLYEKQSREVYDEAFIS